MSICTVFIYVRLFWITLQINYDLEKLYSSESSKSSSFNRIHNLTTTKKKCENRLIKNLFFQLIIKGVVYEIYQTMPLQLPLKNFNPIFLSQIVFSSNLTEMFIKKTVFLGRLQKYIFYSSFFKQQNIYLEIKIKISQKEDGDFFCNFLNSGIFFNSLSCQKMSNFI